MSTLQLTVNSAVLNKSFEMFGKMECFVKVLVNKTEYRTGIVPGSKDTQIVWNQTLNIPLRNAQNTTIQIFVMDEDMTKDDICGQGYVRLGPCGVLNPGVNRYQLRLFDSKLQQINGELNFTSRYM